MSLPQFFEHRGILGPDTVIVAFPYGGKHEITVFEMRTEDAVVVVVVVCDMMVVVWKETPECFRKATRPLSISPTLEV